MTHGLCKQYGVDPYKQRCEVILTAAELEERRNQNHAFMEQGTVMMGHLNHFMEENDFVFFLQDRRTMSFLCWEAKKHSNSPPYPI